MQLQLVIVPFSLSSLLPFHFLISFPSSLSSLLQQKLSEAQKACERVYVLEELIETLQEEQQVSYDTASSGQRLMYSRRASLSLFAEREQP